jgi:acyl dehydratase
MLHYLRSALRLVAREIRARGGGGTLRGERVVVEEVGLNVNRRQLDGYLEVTRGAGIARYAERDAPLPVLFPATWETRLLLRLLCHPRAPSVRGGIEYLATEVVQARPLRAGGEFRVRMELERVEADPRGARLHLWTRTWNASGHLGTESRTLLLARAGRSSGSDGEEGGSAHREEMPDGEWRELAGWALRSRDGRRYALASGDFNPIHLSRLTARPFGRSRPVLHGPCTAALMAHALVEHHYAGAPERLRRLIVAFPTPLLLPATVRLLVALDGEGRGRFRLLGEGHIPFAEGQFGGA